MVTRGLRRRVHRRRSTQSVAVSLTSRFFVKNVVRAWAIRPDLAWPFASVDRFAGLVPYGGSAEVLRARLLTAPAALVYDAGRPVALIDRTALAEGRGVTRPLALDALARLTEVGGEASDPVANGR